MRGFNPFSCKSEGIRRLSVALMILSLLSWVAWVAVRSNGFSEMGPTGTGWLMLFGAPIAAYLLILAVLRITSWIVQGFRSGTRDDRTP